MKRYYYSNSIEQFITDSTEQIIGALTIENRFSSETNQNDAWVAEIELLKKTLVNYNGHIFFEYSIPRMGKRIDVVLVIENVIFVLEFKVGQKSFLSSDIDQVWDYCLDLKNFHETSHDKVIAPILIATAAKDATPVIQLSAHNDGILFPIETIPSLLDIVINNTLSFIEGDKIDINSWSSGHYSPTPTIIEAALALYNKHNVHEISRKDATAVNLKKTSEAINQIISQSKSNNTKSICFVTGVPGAGKTLVGLDIATKNLDSEKGSTSVFLSGNGPLVAILREALTRDRYLREKKLKRKVKKESIKSGVKTFIQNVHHFRDECLIDLEKAPFDHVAIFDEAQRAWNHEQTASFMRRKKNTPNFTYSEPEFLISCLDRHKDWAVVICLVGGGQEINTGEAGISEWIASINRSFPDWRVHVSSKLTDSEYSAGKALVELECHNFVNYVDDLHLSVSMRSFRASHLSLFVKNLLDLNANEAKENYRSIKHKYPIVITREVDKAKKWLKSKARGSERYGIVVSSQAQRLKPFAIDVKSPIDPIHWFLDGKQDVRSSFYLEDVATEFHVQGLELDWSCVTWDADFRLKNGEWDYNSFVGDRWKKIKKETRKTYLKNAYRVLLTRARQGMVIVVPMGNSEDPTRDSSFYDGTFEYLKKIGLEEI